MVASIIDDLQSLLEKNAACAFEADAQVLLLEPIGPMSGLTPTLLDRREQSVGRDIECEIRLHAAGVHSRHAVIFRGQKQVFIKVSDPRTWLNGHPVTESPLVDGDLLRFGEIEFRVRAATTDDLLRDLPATERTPHNDDRSDSTEKLVLRRTRVSSIPVRLKDLCKELVREFERLDAGCLASESARAELDSAWAELKAARTRFLPKRIGIAQAQADAAAKSPLNSTTRESRAEHGNVVEKLRRNNADLLNQLFSEAARPATDAAPESSRSAANSSVSVTDSVAVQSKRILQADTEVADSVAEYMARLLGRMPGRDGGAVAANHPDRDSWCGLADSENATSRAAGPAPSAQTPPEAVSNRIPRRQQNVEKLRAGVGSLREIANNSARAAVAKHSARKFRKSLAFTLPLAIMSFTLAGVLFLIAGSQSRLYSQAFAIMMLGLIALIGLLNAFRTTKTADRRRRLAASEKVADASKSVWSAGDNRPHEGTDPPESRSA